MGMNFDYLEINSQEYNFRVISRCISPFNFFIYFSFSCTVHVCMSCVGTDVCACMLVETKDKPLVSSFRSDPP